MVVVRDELEPAFLGQGQFLAIADDIVLARPLLFTQHEIEIHAEASCKRRLFDLEPGMPVTCDWNRLLVDRDGKAVSSPRIVVPAILAVIVSHLSLHCRFAS